MKKLKKMPRLTGDIPLFPSREVIYKISITINALASAIDYLAKVVEELDKRSDTNAK